MNNNPNANGITIIHCSEQSFHNQFLTDLTSASKSVIILSPFLSHNRVRFYDSTLHQLTARQVSVEVYTKPKQEQPESLQTTFDSVYHRLTYASINLHLRPGMHEKIAAIDRRILWHGSLNILSHNDTRESMLRFESAELTAEVLADVGLGNIVTTDTIEHENKTNRNLVTPRCPICESAMQRYVDVGMWICVQSPTCSGMLPTQSPETSVSQRTVQRLPLQCPICGEPLQVIQGLSARILCSSATCQFTMDPRISVGILRVLRRKTVV